MKRDKQKEYFIDERSIKVRALRAAARRRAYQVAMRSEEDPVSAYVDALEDQGFIINNSTYTVDYVGKI